MLSDAIVTTILQVRDASTAVEFYRDRLGLRHTGRNSEGQEMFSLAGGNALALMPGSDAAPTGRTELSFEVADIGALGDNGVTFADYDLPGLKTVDHVCVLGSEKAAWFADPDGNVLCLHEVTAEG